MSFSVLAEVTFNENNFEAIIVLEISNLFMYISKVHTSYAARTKSAQL